MEWIDPRYAAVMKALRQAQQARTADDRPVRLFILPAPPGGR
ncbi:hypothetical protein [Streptomyces sp. IBSBF 2435]